jgi:heat shock protein HtpX
MYNQITSNKRKSVVLIVLFIAFVLAIGYILGIVFDYGWGGLMIAAAVSLVMTMVSYFSGDKVALSTAGAQQISSEDNPYLWRIVENLCITEGMPMPKLYIIPERAINAFATGRDPEHASVAVTTGAIEKLENEELEGVLAHELSHVKNYDIRVMTIVIVLVGIIALLSDWILHSFMFGGGDRDRDRGTNPLLLVVGIVLIILAPIIAQLIQLAVSRRREYLADASGALMTRYPEGLARALEKIGHDQVPMEHANAATAHLYISDPFGGAAKWFERLFATHPPLEERIKALRTMA